jgi:regulator of protease activity HflC (stomatin/prohibitin superfamily)
MRDNEFLGGVILGSIVLGVIGSIIGGLMWGIPHYRVYSQTLAGEAVLREAEFSRQVAVEEAKAKLESSKLFAQAEVERAKGVADANRIIGGSLEGNDDYLRYLWVQSLENGSEPTIVYVPTEAGLPLLESTRLKVGNE